MHSTLTYTCWQPSWLLRNSVHQSSNYSSIQSEQIEQSNRERAIASAAAAICQFHNNILIRFDSIEMFAPQNSVCAAAVSAGPATNPFENRSIYFNDHFNGQPDNWALTYIGLVIQHGNANAFAHFCLNFMEKEEQRKSDLFTLLQNLVATIVLSSHL